MNWHDIEQARSTLVPATGGYTAATRGVITLPDGRTAFIKIANDTQTQDWLRLERKAYHWLSEQGYRHIPQLLAESDSGLAVTDLSACDWTDTWTVAKVEAMLQAMAALAELSEAAQDAFNDAGRQFPSNLWPTVPESTAAFTRFVDSAVNEQLDAVLQDKAIRAELTALADANPWRGTELVHYDARADNFAFDSATGEGKLVDWNWLQLGSAAFDRTAMLVNVQLSGFAVLPQYAGQLDTASLAWLSGFWLVSATGPQDTEGLRRLRPRQVHNALTAYHLLRAL